MDLLESNSTRLQPSSNMNGRLNKKEDVVSTLTQEDETTHYVIMETQTREEKHGSPQTPK